LPSSPYSASKAASDHLVRAYHRTYGLQVTLSNCSNNYGPFQFPEKLVALMITHILDGRRLPIYGDGSNVRDWLYVTDHCGGIERILAAGRPGETYNIGGNEEHSNLALVTRLCRIVDRLFALDPGLAKRYPHAPPARGDRCETLISFVPDRPGHDQRYAVDAGKLCRDLGFTPAETFATGLEKTVRWYLDNEGWWRAVMHGAHRRWLQDQYGDAWDEARAAPLV
jgi:dTDP-glucose 4,6-dehydratase